LVLYWCGLVIASLCGIAALTILAAIITNKLSDSEAWLAALFFVAVGGLSRLAGRPSPAAADMRFAGVRGLLVCSDYKCSPWKAIRGDNWPDAIAHLGDGCH
jgi:hypothetical protein